MTADPSLDTAIIQATPQVTMALIALFSGLVVGAAASDLRRYIIPNWISIAIALTWCVWALVSPGNPVTSLLIGLAYYGVLVSIEAPTHVPYGLAIAAGGRLMAGRLAGL